MFHFQNTVQDWPRAITTLPSRCSVKAVDRGDILRESKLLKPDIYTVFRHWNDGLQHYTAKADSGWFDWETAKGIARYWFNTHVDGTFIDHYAAFVDAVSWHNEIWANSQNTMERNERISATRAAFAVWNEEFRPMLQSAAGKDIRLVVGEAAVGNDMPIEVARLSINEDGLLGYHPYSWWGNDGQNNYFRAANDWVDLSGRWETMEHRWGLKPTWVFTEAGPFEGAETGWRSSPCLGGSIDRYVEAVRDWIKDVQMTEAYVEGRIKGFHLFTTGGGSRWQSFETKQPEMDRLSVMIGQEWKPGTKPPTPPPPPLDDLHQLAWDATVEMQETGFGGIRLNAKAGIQVQMTEDNERDHLDLQKVTDEIAIEGKVFMAAESLTDLVPRRVYVWEPGEQIYFFEDPNKLYYLTWPVVTDLHSVNSEFFSTRDYGLHEGIDLYGATGDSVVASMQGRVVWSSDQRRSGGDSNYGNHIIIDHPNGWTTWYCHLLDRVVQEGDFVNRGDLIGFVGSTGNSTGPHLHLNLQIHGEGYDGFVLPDVVDPKPYLKQ